MTYPPPPEQPQYPPQYGQPQYGQPQYGQPQYGQPQYDQPYQQPGQPYGYPAPAKHRRVSDPMIGWLILGVAALTIVSAVLPWAKVLDITIKGTAGDGKITIFCGVVLGVLGLLIGIRQGLLWTSITAGGFAVLVTLIGLADVGSVSNLARGANATILGSDAVKVGFGLWLTILAGVLGVGLSIVAIIRRPVQPG